MKKVFLIVLVLMPFVSLAYATPISQQWDRTYGGVDRETIGSIQQTTDGGYILAATTASFGVGMFSILVVKLNSNGEITWQRTYTAGNFIDTVYSIQQTTDGGYILAGGTMPLYNNTMMAMIIKLDANGDILWNKTYPEVVELKCIQQTLDGGYIACGHNFILKLGATGDITWHYAIPSVDFWKAQQTSDGGYVVSGERRNNSTSFDVLALKLASDGDIVWQKNYGGGGMDIGIIHQTAEDEYFITGYTYSFGVGEIDAWILKLNSNGSIIWQKTYGGVNDDSINAIQQTSDGGYLASGETASFGAGDEDLWILKLDDSGNIIWEKTYGGEDYDGASSLQKTSDGGYIVLSATENFGSGGDDLWVLKLDGIGHIPNCDIIGSSNAIISNSTITGLDSYIPLETPPITIAEANIIPLSVAVETSPICYYIDSNDIDGDGVENDLGESLMSSLSDNSLLADTDNCSDVPNGPFLGTCTKGTVGSTCIANEACGVDGICSMNQEDSYPPQGNNRGDSCDCEGDFDCDGDCDGTDALTFKGDFGRSIFDDPCESGDTCNGDFDCDNDCDGTDAALFKFDFGRSSFNNPCPTCVKGVEWCMYP
jgi:hypothetical protein